jgi:hypothetical protein
MLRKLRRHLSYANVMSTLAAFFALAGAGAYAANEWTGANIVDGSLTGQDVFDNTIGSADITNGSLSGTDVANESLGTPDIGELHGVRLVPDSVRSAQIDGVTGNDVAGDTLDGFNIANGSIGVADIGSQQVASDEVLNDSLLQSDIRAGAVTNDEVLDNSLTGTDINESTLVGVRDVCHGGAVLRGRLCAASDSVARTQNNAFDFCESLGFRLPTLGEAKLMARNFNAPGVAGAFWTDSIVDVRPNNLYMSNAVGEDGVHIALFQEDLAKTVCVETPTNVP